MTSLINLLPEILMISTVCFLLFRIAFAKDSFNKQTGIMKKYSQTAFNYKCTTDCLRFIIYWLLFNIAIVLLTTNNSDFYKIAIFNNFIMQNLFSLTIKLLITSTALAILAFSEKTYLRSHNRHLLEYPTIILLILFFLFTIVSANDFIIIAISLIGFSLGLYVLLLNDSTNHAAREAALKYYYLSAFSSGLIIFGILIIYIVFHTTAFSSITWTIYNWVQIGSIYNQQLILTIILYFIIYGFLFKLAAFPGHLWAPSVYEGCPQPVMAFFILPIKIAVFSVLWEILGNVFWYANDIWWIIIWGSSITSMLWGSFGALTEKKIRKFIGYSSINQMGFLLMGFLVFESEYNNTTDEIVQAINSKLFIGISASFIYLLIYIVMNLGLFIIILKAKTSKNISLTFLTDFHHFAKNNWFLSISVVIILFSMAGIPPLAGFFGKFNLLLAAFSSKYYVLVIVALFTSLISTYYYLRIIKILWFEEL